MATSFEADYLVIGCGAMGMAFIDVILNESDATILVLDKEDRPGGHWNYSYPFVRLHQPSSFYGVNSRKLGNDTLDFAGWNEGLYELASGTEVITYFDQVMQQQFIPSGRVQYFPMCRYDGDSSFTSLVTGETYSVQVNRKTVNASYMNVTVPSMRDASYEIVENAQCVPLNEIPKLHSRGHQFEHYVIVGAGKTGMDAALWLLRNDIDPDHIVWIMPRDSWLLDRKNIQPGQFLGNTLTAFAQQSVAISESSSIDDMFERVNACGQLLRLDENVKPTMYRCATVTEQELGQLRRIKNVVRMGRVQRIELEKIVLDEGEVETSIKNLHIDCSADGLERRPVVPVFDGQCLTLQTVRPCQQVFSAAFIAHIELSYKADDKKNDLCTVIPHPDSDIDFLKTTLANGQNTTEWAQLPELQTWLQNSRLDGFTPSLDDLANLSPETQASLGQVLFTDTPRASEKLQEYLDQIA